jgi:hypothetical protein
MTERPRTADEMAALPEGPAFGQTTRVIDGRTVRIPVMEPTAAYWCEDADIIGYTDQHGVRWTLGLHANGTWFRQRH